jgi:plastocyanin
VTLTRKKIGIVGAAAILAASLTWFLIRAPRGVKTQPKVHVVKIQAMVFTPKILHISRGDSVTWINEDIFLHAVKSTDASHAWQSKDLPFHGSWTKTFTANQSYLCPYHPTMIGEIAITEP